MSRGVEIRESSIRLSFAHNGRTERKTLMVEGQPMLPTPANVKYANRLIVEIRDRIKSGSFHMVEYFPINGTVARGGSVADQLDHWLSLQKIEPSTRKGYEAAVKFWRLAVAGSPALPFGQRQLTSLRHSDVLAALMTKPNYSGKTINNYVSVLQSALKLAVKDKVIEESPAEDIDRAAWQKTAPDPFDLAEAEAICAAMPVGQVRNMVEFRFFAGVRTSEMVGLRWRSIDFNKRHAAISEAIVLQERKDTKTNVARIVNLNSRAYAALRAQKEHTFLKGEVVFTDPRYGTAWLDERAFRRTYWTPTLKRLGIRYRPPNNARHSYATMLLMAGATPGYAAKQMGHSVEIFLSTYTKWIDGGQNEVEQARLESFLSAPPAAKKDAA